MIPLARVLRPMLCIGLVAVLPSVRLAAQDVYGEKLVLASDGEADDWFGFCVALAGEVTAVAQLDLTHGQTEIGEVYVVEGFRFPQEFRLQGSGLVPEDMFARSVDTDGTRIVVGAPQTETLARDGLGGNGKVYVFRRDVGGWQEEVVLTANDGVVDDFFGWSVAVDGNRIAIGAPGVSDSRGSVYVFEYDGTLWNQQAKVALGPDLGVNSGYAVALQGDVLVTGAPNAHPWWHFNPVGHAIACRWTGASWQEHQLYSPSGVEFGVFGAAVDVDGDRIVVGGPAVPGQGYPGEVAVFDFDGNNYSSGLLLTASNGVADDRFGHDVELTRDRLVIGAPGVDANTGAIYVLRYDGGSWVEEQEIQASDAAPGDSFGSTLGGRAGLLAVGASKNDDLGSDSGSVYHLNAPSFRSYGEGLAGSGGFVPTLGASGDAQSGGVVTLESRDGLGGALSLLFVGVSPASTPVFGGTLLVDFTSGFFLRIRLQGAPGVPGAGFLDLPGNVPPDVSSVSVYLQQWTFDRGAVAKVSMSAGLEINLTD